MQDDTFITPLNALWNFIIYEMFEIFIFIFYEKIFQRTFWKGNSWATPPLRHRCPGRIYGRGVGLKGDYSVIIISPWWATSGIQRDLTAKDQLPAIETSLRFTNMYVYRLHIISRHLDKSLKQFTHSVGQSLSLSLSLFLSVSLSLSLSLPLSILAKIMFFFLRPDTSHAVSRRQSCIL